MSDLVFHIIKIDKGWHVSIHSPHGDKSYHRRHVHIKKKGIDGEYSWNSDGTRHDAHKFPNSEKAIESAKRKASEALQIPINKIQFISYIEPVNCLEIADAEYSHSRRIVRSEFNILPNEQAFLFETDTSVILVIESLQ